MPSRTLIRRLRLPLSRLLAVALFACIAVSTSAWEHVSVVSTALFLAGCVLAGIASLGRLWCAVYIAGYKSGTLITVGPYSMCRNPLYFFSLLGGLGIGLATETLFFPAVILLVFALYYPVVIRHEQDRLLSLHGNAFVQYCQSTPAFFPRWSLLNEPETYEIKTFQFRKQMFSGLWFIWLLGIMEMLESLRETGILPTWLSLY